MMACIVCLDIVYGEYDMEADNDMDSGGISDKWQLLITWGVKYTYVFWCLKGECRNRN